MSHFKTFTITNVNDTFPEKFFCFKIEQFKGDA